MREKHRVRIKELVGEMSCPKDFQCVESGFLRLCEAEDVGSDHFMRCMETDSLACQFAAPCRGAVYCECPLRVFICRKLGL